MTQEVVEVKERRPEAAPFPRHSLPAAVNAGAVAIEQERAIAETQGKLILAKRFPRSVPAAVAEFLDACKSPEFAAAAFYTVPNRGSGPSIRFAEEAARCYGNFDYGHKELSRDEGKSEVEVYAWDMEKNNFSRRQITVMHIRDKTGGAVALKDQADIDNRIANVASKQIRGRILALLSKDLVAKGIAECKKTLAGGNDKPVGQRVIDMTAAFGRLGVSAEMLARRLNHRLDDTTIDELADLAGIYNAIREGAKASDYFSAEKEDADAAGALATAGAADAGASTKAATKAATKASDKPPADPAGEQQAAVEETPPAAAKEPPVADETASQKQSAPAAQEEAVF